MNSLIISIAFAGILAMPIYTARRQLMAGEPLAMYMSALALVGIVFFLKIGIDSFKCGC